MIKSKALKIWKQGIRRTIADYGVTQGIMMFIVAAIMLAVMLPVLNGVMNAAPQYVTNANDVGNLAGGGGVLGSASMNATQTTLYGTVGSSYGLLVVVLILISAAVILGAIGLFRYFGGQE
jgi:hypothetical protein